MSYYTYINSPVGQLLLAGSAAGLSLISFPSGSRCKDPQPDWNQDAGPFAAATDQLNAYFAGELTEFNLPLAPEGTPFQLAVWQALQTIPYGETVSYGKLAHTIGRAKAVRAVGAANGANPLPIVIPCHRVIGSNGKLTGFGGGIETKAMLLQLERKNHPASGQQTALAL